MTQGASDILQSQDGQYEQGMGDWFGGNQGLESSGSTLGVSVHLGEPVSLPFWL